MHRVVERFVGTHVGSMRADFEAHAAGHGLTAQIDFELASYESGMLDDSFAESPHAIFTQIGKCAPASKPVFWAGTFRMSQNLALKTKLDLVAPGRFGYFFKRWRSIWQTNVAKSRLCIPKRNSGSASVLLRRVYRVGEFSVQDIDVMPKVQAQFALDNKTVPLGEKKSYVAKAMIEYLVCMLQDGSVYSLKKEPEPTDLFSTDAAEGNASPPMPPALFEVMDMTAGNKVYQDCEDIAVIKAMRFPVMSKDLVITNYCGSELERHCVTSETPTMVDLLHWQWSKLKNKLLVWKTDRVTDTAGSMSVAEPSFLHQRAWCLK